MYGRNPKSKKAAQRDLDNNLDWQVNDITDLYDGKPINKSQLTELGVVTVNARSADLRKLWVLRVR